MRKVFLKACFVICIALSSIAINFTNPHAEEVKKVEVVPGEEYIYYKIFINNKVYILVVTIDGAFVDLYPDGCPGHGGPL